MPLTTKQPTAMTINKRAALTLFSLLFYIAAVHYKDFAVSVVPGWHTTIYPPYFILSVVATVVLVIVSISYLLPRAAYLGNQFIWLHLTVSLATFLLASITFSEYQPLMCYLLYFAMQVYYAARLINVKTPAIEPGR